VPLLLELVVGLNKRLRFLYYQQIHNMLNSTMSQSNKAQRCRAERQKKKGLELNEAPQSWPKVTAVTQQLGTSYLKWHIFVHSHPEHLPHSIWAILTWVYHSENCMLTEALPADHLPLFFFPRIIDHTLVEASLLARVIISTLFVLSLWNTSHSSNLHTNQSDTTKSLPRSFNKV
jgi:hypothetical protein